VVKVILGKSASSIALYPNPVRGSGFNLQLNNLDQGNYTLSLTNKLGQLIYTKTISHAGGSAAQFVEIGNIPKGDYQLKIGDFGTQVIKE